MIKPQLSKNVVDFTARRVIYETPLPIGEVLARLEKETNKEGSGPAAVAIMRQSKTRSELETGYNAMVGKIGFLFFFDNAYHDWLNAYTGTTTTPLTYTYTFGNPLIAQGMLRYDLVGTLHIPPKLVLTETPGGGTKVVYDDPATTIPVPAVGGEDVHPEVKSAAQGLSEKIGELVQFITKP